MSLRNFQKILFMRLVVSNRCGIVVLLLIFIAIGRATIVASMICPLMARNPASHNVISYRENRASIVGTPSTRISHGRVVHRVIL